MCTASSLEQHLGIASVGAELNVNAGVLTWDYPYRLRVGVAAPIQNGAALGAKGLSVYFTSGLSF